MAQRFTAEQVLNAIK